MKRRARLMRFALWSHRRCWLKMHDGVVECLTCGQSVSLADGTAIAGCGRTPDGSLTAKAQEDG